MQSSGDCTVTWRYNNKEKMAKRFTASIEGKDGEEFKRGTLLYVLIFVFRKGQCQWLLLVLWQFCFMRMEVFTGKSETGLWRTVELFWFVHLLLFFPSWIWEKTFEQGLLTGSLEAQRELGQGEIRKPAALQRKKYQWPWTVLIFPNQIRCGEENRREATSPAPPSQAEEASGNI